MYTKDITYKGRTRPLAFKVVKILSTKKAIDQINIEILAITMSTHSQDDVSTEEFNFCCFASQVRIPTYMQPALLVSFQGAGLKKIETYGLFFTVDVP